MNIKHQVCSDFIVEALETFFDMRVTNRPDWVNDARLSLKNALLDMCEECGVSADATPSSIVDNFLINGDFISRDDWEEEQGFNIDAETDEEEVKQIKNEAWQEFCQNECVLSNDKYACRSF